MEPYVGCIYVPTQIRTPQEAIASISDTKARLMNQDTVPLVYVPECEHSEYVRVLEIALKHVDTLDRNLHKLYLFYDKALFDEMVLTIVSMQWQRRLLTMPLGPQYILSLADLRKLTELLDKEELISQSILDWTVSKEGTYHRRIVNRAHAEMLASFNAWVEITRASFQHPDHQSTLALASSIHDTPGPSTIHTLRATAPSVHRRPSPIVVPAPPLRCTTSDIGQFSSHSVPNNGYLRPPLSPFRRHRGLSQFGDPGFDRPHAYSSSPSPSIPSIGKRTRDEDSYYPSWHALDRPTKRRRLSVGSEATLVNSSSGSSDVFSMGYSDTISLIERGFERPFCCEDSVSSSSSDSDDSFSCYSDLSVEEDEPTVSAPPVNARETSSAVKRPLWLRTLWEFLRMKFRS